MNLLGYIRVSRVGGRGGEDFIAPRVQRERIESWAKTYGHSVDFLPDELDQSGGKLKRPVFTAALERCERGEADGIIVAKLDRFARSVPDAATAIRRLEDAGAVLVSVADQLDTSTPMGRFARTMMLAVAELELDRIRESWATAQQYAVKRGVHIASRPPTGYKRGQDGRLELVPRSADAVAEVFQRRAAGASLSELAQLLEQRRVVGPYQNKHWTATAISKLLKNPVYTGQARSGIHSLEDAHPAIITGVEWRAAQTARGVVSPLRSPDGALLAGLLRCAGCRYVMKLDSIRDRDGSKLRMYRCRGDHAAGRCPAAASVLAHIIEPYVVSVFFEALGPDGILADAGTDDAGHQQAQHAAEAAQADLAEWLEVVSISSVGRAAYMTGIEARQRRVDEALSAASAAATPSSAATLPEVASLREAWPTLRTDEQRRLLAAGIDAIVLRKGRDLAERSLILFAGEAPDDLPSRGRRVPLASYPWPDTPGDAGVAVA
jgi:site-specific DNA recombinase